MICCCLLCNDDVIMLLLFIVVNGSDSDEEVDTEMIDTSTGQEKSGKNYYRYILYCPSKILPMCCYVF